MRMIHDKPVDRTQIGAELTELERDGISEGGNVYKDKRQQALDDYLYSAPIFRL